MRPGSSRAKSRDDLVREGQRVMTVCNACRYCEAYCPVFDAMEDRLVFTKGDLTYLANLCHNCGECLYACQYAPPHEFGIDVPRMLAGLRLASYEEFCWPSALGGTFRRHELVAPLALAVSFVVLLLTMTAGRTRSVFTASTPADFYRVMPHHVMVTLFAIVGLFVLGALGVGLARFWREVAKKEKGILFVQPAEKYPRPIFRALRDALTLKHLHTTGVDCTDREETRQPWRRWCHHLTFYGFLLCFASTSVAAVYHVVFGWRAPYAYGSLPVVLGTAGGIGLLVGPAGFFVLQRRRDPMLTDPGQSRLDTSFLGMLLLTSLTGLLLLLFRARAVMPALLLVHLGFVLALFLTMPYGKFVHGIYRTVALIKYGVRS